ncbi:MAG: UTP--glucose-1-phosphate uridylyltransferase GalU [Candidatus Riflebacteria bacterium]|nr:UTP--glucose-1-phosphate uridylyltransferase GalU [Candidatus Riflebacteria bacterium]
MKKIRKAIFPVAGLGTRFLPATKSQPKVMLPIVDKPIIHYVVEEALGAGIETIIFVTGRSHQAIENYFDISVELEDFLREKKKEGMLREINDISNLITPCYIRQRVARGLGHAVLMAKDLIGDEPFAVFLADDVIDAEVPCMKQMIDVYERYQCSVIAVMEVDPKDTRAYGIIEPRDLQKGFYQILDMVEKPDPKDAPSNLAVIGRYILTPEIFDLLESTEPGKGGEIQLTDAIKALLKRQAVYGYAFQGKRFDTGDKLGFLEATVEYALKNPEVREGFRKYLLDLYEEYATEAARRPGGDAGPPPKG